ncbi:L,D-transpeptidase family protein [Guptibacillus hwajinpoensis]|uniref:Lipoprotein-anchoring transpeptidase ErfK/SrfK n=1 Tax=Guptibacillus hwajinpoensis TaxID=208199 RepID=A0ABU0K455_9BACL|nr:L,D-transpeptidase family protein [Alkalihalobacillus hemicentroti]MDQ0483069.1 lipoprotein-anchoring transpeptidase ErfK/SrfK [Alkalihalobacillus hemicentroti]
MKHIVKPGETLSSISGDYRVPLLSIIQANSLSNPNLIYPGQLITIPGYPDPFTLPYTIYVSLKNRTLSLLKNGSVIKVYPVGVGRMLHDTPSGNFIIINKAPNPGGPFGTMWMSISKIHYGIHGTNDPSSIGKYVSRGCIRMQNSDVEDLAMTIPIGTSVTIGQ